MDAMITTLIALHDIGKTKAAAQLPRARSTS
jgi:hypothetical protein